MKTDKIRIGSAQFGSKYGISNLGNKVSIKEVEKILELCEENNINKIDTASEYGNTEEILGSIGIPNWKIQSKFYLKKEFFNQIEKNIKKNVENSLKKLNVKKLDSLLLHNEDQLLDTKKEEIYSSLESLKSDGYISNFGVSFYNPGKLIDTINLFDLDIVQIPLNVFDHRFINYLDIVKTKVKNIQVRSIFLQGLLLMKKSKRSLKFKRWEDKFSSFEDWNIANNISPLQSCINFISNINEVNDVILGVQSSKEFEEIIAAFRHSNLKTPNIFKCEDESLINPTRWSEL